MKRRLLGLIGCLLLFGWTDVASGQIVTGTIIGEVQDESGAPVPGVTATVTSPALPGGPAVQTTTNLGTYRFTLLPPGVYELTLTLQGFSTYREDGLRVTAAGTLERNVRLTLSTVEETITVSGVSPLVDTRRVAVAHVVTKELVENVEHQRYSIQEYAKWVPGVSAGDPSSRSQTVNVMGSPANENTWQIDGVAIDSNGGLIQGSDVDLVEEVQISTLGASAEYANAQGAVFNVIAKSGTNQFSGTASLKLQPDGFISKPIKLPCNCAEGETGFARTGYHDYAAHAGGPIVSDHLWYFGGFHVWERKESTPGINPAFAAFDQDNKISSKVTWQITQGMRLNTLLTDEPFNTPGRPSPTTPMEVLTDGTGHPGIWTYGSEFTSQLSDRTLLTARVGLTGYTFDRLPKTGDFVTPNRTDQLTGMQSGGVREFQTQNLWRTTQAVKLNHFVQTQTIDHDLRGGVQFDQNRTSTRSSFPSGVQYLDLSGAPDQAIVMGVSASGSLGSVSGSSYKSYGVWGEDQLTIKDRLSLSLGVRYDNMRAISQDLPAIDNLLNATGATAKGLGNLFTWKTVSPRLGFNYKLSEAGDMVVRGNYSRAYRAMNLREITPLHPGQTPTILRRYDPATRDYTTTVSVTDPLSNIAVDPETESPWTDQYSIGFDRQLAATVAMGVSVVYKHGENQLGWVDRGGAYGLQNVTLPDGRTLTVMPLLNSPRDRRITLTNGPGYFNTYKGLLLSLSKRYSNNWAGEISYTLSESTGLMRPPAGLTASTAGQDPNDDINFAGPLTGIDRPHMLLAQSTYRIAPVDVMVSASIMIVSGLPYAPQALVQLPQGRRSVNIVPPGDEFRAPRQDLVTLRFSKIIGLGGARKFEVMANVNNVLQDESYQTYRTLNFFTADFARPNAWIEPRNMNLAFKVTW